MPEVLETRSAREFQNPFYVIVHAEAPVKNKFYRKKGSVKKTLTQIEQIRRNYDYATIDDKTSPDTILPDIPKERPVLVCGFFRDICVREQRDALRNAGYQAHISREGTYSFN